MVENQGERWTIRRCGKACSSRALSSLAAFGRFIEEGDRPKVVKDNKIIAVGWTLFGS